MPEFIADFIPDGLDDFTSGYLQCAEFCNQDDWNDSDESGNRWEEVQGWSERAITTATRDCAKFQADNAALLESYYAESGRTEESAGNDFWYSRNGHGVGFFDRGKADCFESLQESARCWPDVDMYVSDSGELEFS
jgi:hypothetical protein